MDDEYHTSYSINWVEYKNEVNEISKTLSIIFLSITITALVFSLFFMLLDTTNYINEQLPDIIVLRNIGITKAQVVHTYFLKLSLKLSSSFIIGFILGILATYHLKSLNHKTSFMFQVNPITLLLGCVIGAFILGVTIYLYLRKKFSSTASTIKTKNKI